MCSNKRKSFQVSLDSESSTRRKHLGLFCIVCRTWEVEEGDSKGQRRNQRNSMKWISIEVSWFEQVCIRTISSRLSVGSLVPRMWLKRTCAFSLGAKGMIGNQQCNREMSTNLLNQAATIVKVIHILISNYRQVPITRVILTNNNSSL